MSEAQEFYDSLSPEGKMKLAALSLIMGNERVGAALTECNDIDELFSTIANMVYGAH